MYYEINISKNNRHVFATAERSITTEWQMQKIRKLLEEKFPKEEGYEITVTRFEKKGYLIP